MNSWRIVLVMTEPPLPFGHASARWYYLLFKGLVERGHRVTAFASASKAREMETARDLFPASTYDLRCYPQGSNAGVRNKVSALLRPCSYMFSASMQNDLNATLRSGFDVLQMEQVWSGWLGLSHPRKSLLHVHNLWQVDMSGSRSPKMVERLRMQRLFRAERKIVAGYPNICCCSARLEKEIRSMNSSATIDRIPAALDLSGYPYIANESRSASPTVSLIGNMEWAPTLSAARRLVSELWPQIKKAVPHAHLQLVGWGAKRFLGEYAEVQDITIEENVPDTHPYFENSAILLYAPERGSGMKIKVLEALAYGVPVVTTSEGAEGIPMVDHVHAGISDHDEGLIARAIGLLQSTELQNSQRESGRRLLEKNCNPSSAITRLELIYNAISSRN